MTLISEIVLDAYRENNIISASATPTATESAEGLRLLNRFIAGLFGSEAGEELQPYTLGRANAVTSNERALFNPSGDSWVPPQAQLVLNLQSAETVNLNPHPQDGMRFSVIDSGGTLATTPLTIRGNGRKIEGANSLVLSTNGEARSWFYRAELANWQKLTTLTAIDKSPFPVDFDDVLICGLAMRLNPRHGKQTSQETAMTYQSILSKFKARYNQIVEMPSELALLRTLGVKDLYVQFDSFSNNERFNNGHG